VLSFQKSQFAIQGMKIFTKIPILLSLKLYQTLDRFMKVELTVGIEHTMELALSGMLMVEMTLDSGKRVSNMGEVLKPPKILQKVFYLKQKLVGNFYFDSDFLFNFKVN